MKMNYTCKQQSVPFSTTSLNNSVMLQTLDDLGFVAAHQISMAKLTTVMRPYEMQELVTTACDSQERAKFTSDFWTLSLGISLHNIIYYLI